MADNYKINEHIRGNKEERFANIFVKNATKYSVYWFLKLWLEQLYNWKK